MTQPLFFTPRYEDLADTSVKLAAEATLSEDPNQWPSDVLQELYKQVPYIADFEPHIQMERVDAERAFGFGAAEISNKTDAPRGVNPRQAMAAGIKKIRVPIVIKSGKLQPMDIMVTEDNKMLPLTESRLRQALFRPQSFDVTGKSPGDQSLIGQLYPPYRQNYGFGGGGVAMTTGMGKESSALEQYLTRKAQEKVAFSVTPEGHAFDAEVAAIKRDAAERLMALSQKHKGFGHRKPDGSTQMGSLGKNLRGFTPPADGILGLPADHRHWAAVEKAHRAGKNVYNPFAGMLTPTDSEVGGSALQYGRIDPDRAKNKKEGKEKKSSVLEAILPTISPVDYNRFKQKVAQADIRQAFEANADAAVDALSLLARGIPMNKTAAVLASMVHPSVVQIRSNNDGRYTVKTASHKCWAPREFVVTRDHVVRDYGEKVAYDVDISGSVTVAEDADAEEVVGPEEPRFEVITESGNYVVKTPEGDLKEACVIPNLIDTNGLIAPIAIAVCDGAVAVQSQVCGISMGGPCELEPAEVGGYGFFFEVLPSGQVQATVPLEIKGSTEVTGESRTYIAETFDGRPIDVSVQPNLKRVVSTGNKLLIPEHFEWTSLGDYGSVALCSSPEELDKQAAAQRSFASVWVRSDGQGTFSFVGTPLDKLASAERSFLSLPDALFLLSALGVEQGYGISKLGHAVAMLEPTQIRVGRVIVPEAELRKQAAVAAAETLSHLPYLRKDLTKEAAFLPDPSAVDTVLSLQFLNPENLLVFVSYLPQLDETQQKLCEMLLASRLGLKEVPSSALEKVVRALEEVIEGLRVLAFQHA